MENVEETQKVVNLNIMLPPITNEHIDKFGATYRHNGVAIVLSDAHKAFAVAFASAVVQSLLPIIVQQVGGHFVQNPPPQPSPILPGA